jgi:hypothetical protein
MSNAATIKKLCVFCGKLPEVKTMEHVVPKWLLELTGNPNRTGIFGAYASKEGEPIRQREFGLSAFKFAACEACNNEYSKLEDRAKDAMVKTLANEELDNTELTTLLDWFDKIRIGLHLAFNRLDDFADIITPTIYIELGQGLKDRVLLVYDHEDANRKVLTYYGVQSPIFYIMPNAFVLTVKDKVFLSAAADYLVAQKLGYPYGEFICLQDDSPDPVYRLRPGTGHTTYPVLRLPVVPGGIEIYQAVVSMHNFPGANSALRSILLHDEKLVCDSLRNYGSDEVRMSRIFYKKPTSDLTLLAEDEKLSLQPPTRLPLPEIAHVMASMFLEFQLGIWLSYQPSSLDDMTPKQRTFLPELINATIHNQIDFLRNAVAPNPPSR